MNDPTCHSEACAGRCARSIHAHSYERGQYRYMRCTTHRLCREFVPEASVLAEEVSSDGQLIEEPPAVATPPVARSASSPFEPMDLTPDEQHAFLASMNVLGDRPIESFNAWRCPVCGMRSFRQDSCHRVMEPVRVEIHSREVP